MMPVEIGGCPKSPFGFAEGMTLLGLLTLYQGLTYMFAFQSHFPAAELLLCAERMEREWM